MSREIWKGSISFGLINIPVAIVPAENNQEKPVFNLLDRRDHAHIGYKKINKRTGKTVSSQDIVKGYKLESGKYTLFDDKDLAKLRFKGTQTIELQQFVKTDEVDSSFFERPYFLVPQKGAEKTYVLLRDTLAQTEKYGVGLVVLHNKQHLVLIGSKGPALFMELLRYADELKSPDDYDLPAQKNKSLKLSAGELAMAARLVEDLTRKWKPELFEDSYLKDLKAAVKRRAKVRVPEDQEDAASNSASSSHNVVDLMPLLEKSLRQSKMPKSKAR